MQDHLTIKQLRVALKIAEQELQEANRRHIEALNFKYVQGVTYPLFHAAYKAERKVTALLDRIKVAEQ